MILITGANGQLGFDFQRLFNKIGEEYVATDYQELDITDIKKVREFVKNLELEGKRVSLIINCAAYNNVDKAEEESEMCYKLNAYAPRDLALVAKEIGADYITYSTDFVFDGKKGAPYTEEDAPSPLSVYSKAKVEGERLVSEINSDAYIVRTSWVFGVANNNFNKQVVNWSLTRDKLAIVADQTSSPTYSKDLALYSWKLIQAKKPGLYHLSNGGVASKYDQASYVLSKSGWKGHLDKAKSSDFVLPAARGEFTKLDSSKLESVIGEKLPTWEDGIDRYLLDSKELEF